MMKPALLLASLLLPKTGSFDVRSELKIRVPAGAASIGRRFYLAR
jgi:hypothetical protein